MADPEQLRILKEQGVGAWNEWRQGAEQTPINLAGAGLSAANLSGADLSGAILSGADLREADLSAAILYGANLYEADLSAAHLREADLRKSALRKADLSGANLNEADLSGAGLIDARLDCATLTHAHLRESDLRESDLRGADLRGANLSAAHLSAAHLRGANLSGADLSGANLNEADLSGAGLIDARLDCATLTRAHLWETQRGGWSIRGVICRGAFWDREAKELTEYEEGEFERLFAEKPRIVLRYAGGISPIDLIALPVIVERLQSQHLDSVLQIRSVQNDAGGASVVITVEDLKDRGTEAFAVEFEKIRAELVTTQHRLQNEEKVRIAFEAQCKVLVDHVIPTLAATPKGDTTYNVGQAGAVGPHAHAHDMTFQQIQGGLDLPKLAEELGRLRNAMKGETTGTRDEDKAIGAVADAEEAATKGDGPAVLRYLKSAGTWGLKIAEKIGVALAIEALKNATT